MGDPSLLTWIVLGGFALLGVVCLLAWSAGRGVEKRPVATTAAPAISARPPPAPSPPPPPAVPSTAPSAKVDTRPDEWTPIRISYEEDEELDPTKVGGEKTTRMVVQPPTAPILFDEDAALEEPTRAGAIILVSATAQTDRGQKRKRNEDSLLANDDHSLYVVADGMGGYYGGDVASALMVQTIAEAFQSGRFDGPPHANIPRRASELARAIQMGNAAILSAAEKDPTYEGMGTTVCAARFSPNKQRLYLGHVGDSRCYRIRQGAITPMTSDHTVGRELGIRGPEAKHLSRAAGIWPTVTIDIVIAKPLPGDLYLLCSDGLTKMLSDEDIARLVAETPEPAAAVERLVEAANARGGKDNITVILVRVNDPSRLAV
jgi:protein phosphatase